MIDKLEGGLADNMRDDQFDPIQLKKGTMVEMEHTSDETLAKEIAKDHLVEDPNYYIKLKTIHESLFTFDEFVNEMYSRGASSNQGVPIINTNIAGIEEEDQNSYVLLERDGKNYIIEENNLDEFTEYCSTINKTYNIEDSNVYINSVITEDGTKEKFNSKHTIRFRNGKWVVPNISPITA